MYRAAPYASASSQSFTNRRSIVRPDAVRRATSGAIEQKAVEWVLHSALQLRDTKYEMSKLWKSRNYRQR